MSRFARAAHDNTAQAAHDDTGLYLVNGLDLVQLWQDNAQYDCIDDSFSSKQDRYFPQP